MSCARDPQDPTVPRLAELDQVIAAHAFRRAAAAFADAVAAAHAHQLGTARKLAAEATEHLAMAERAQNGLGFRTPARPQGEP